MYVLAEAKKMLWAHPCPPVCPLRLSAYCCNSDLVLYCCNNDFGSLLQHCAWITLLLETMTLGHIVATMISDRIIATMTLVHVVETVSLDTIVAFGTIAAFVIPWLPC